MSKMIKEKLPLFEQQKQQKQNQIIHRKDQYYGIATSILERDLELR